LHKGQVGVNKFELYIGLLMDHKIKKMDKTLKEIIAVLIKIPQADCIPVKMPSIISLQNMTVI